MRKLRSRLIPALVLGAALASQGCGSNSEPPPPNSAHPAAPVKKVTSPADTLSPDLVGGVVTGKGGAALLQVKFELAGRPVVGQPVDVDMVVLPQADNIELFSGTIQGEDGLEVVSGDAFPVTEKPAYGVPVHHNLKVIPKRDGIFTLSATMSIASGGQSLNPVYSFPVLAGNGMADAAAAATAGATQAKPAGPGATR